MKIITCCVGVGVRQPKSLRLSGKRILFTSNDAVEMEQISALVAPFDDERTLFAHWLLRQIYVNSHLTECLFASRLFFLFFSFTSHLACHLWIAVFFGAPFVSVWFGPNMRQRQHFSCCLFFFFSFCSCDS